MTQGYIRFSHEGLFNLEAYSDKVPAHGIHSLAVFCDNLNLDIREFNKVRRKALKDGKNECTYAHWTITWMNLDQWRDWLHNEYKIKLATRMRRIHGNIPASKDDFDKKDQSFAKYLFLFMGK